MTCASGLSFNRQTADYDTTGVIPGWYAIYSVTHMPLYVLNAISGPLKNIDNLNSKFPL